MKKIKKESEAKRLVGDEKIIEKVIREHPEYSEALEDWARVYDAETKIDPHLHLIIHEVIERQLSASTPPEVSQTLDRLMKSGLSRHESIHKIGTAVVGEIYDILRSRKPFDEERYVDRLKKLR